MIREARPNARRFELHGVAPAQVKAVFRGQPNPPRAMVAPEPCAPEEYAIETRPHGCAIVFHREQWSHWGPMHQILVEVA